MNCCGFSQYPFYMTPMSSYPYNGNQPYYNPYYNQTSGDQFNEESYIENILRLNLGKTVSIYMNFENSQWGSKIFKGILEAAGKDHIIVSDKETGVRYVLLSIYLNYVTFEEEINYYYPYQDNRPNTR